MDTDNNYMAISPEWLEDIVRTELQAEFEAETKQWLGTSGADAPLGSSSSSVKAAVCSKCYYVVELEGEKKKFSTKRMSKVQNKIT